MRILVVEEKHGTRYLPADTDEQLALSALYLLSERYHAGYWYYDPRDDTDISDAKAAAALTDEQIAALPTEAIRSQARAQRTGATATLNRHQRALDEYEEIQRIVRERDMSVTPLFRRSDPAKVVRLQIPAWDLLERRSDAEYERVALETIEEITIGSLDKIGKDDEDALDDE